MIRPADEGGGEDRPPALAHGELADRPVGEGGEADLLERRLPGLAWLAAQPADQAEDLPHRGIGGEVRLLRDVGQAPPRRHLVGPQVVAVDLHPATIGQLDPGGDLQERALAAAIRADEEGEARPQVGLGLGEHRLAPAVGEADTGEPDHEALQDWGSPIARWWISSQRLTFWRRSRAAAARRTGRVRTRNASASQGRRARRAAESPPWRRISPAAPVRRSGARRRAPDERAARQGKAPASGRRARGVRRAATATIGRACTARKAASVVTRCKADWGSERDQGRPAGGWRAPLPPRPGRG